jgi:predicted cation transporter
VLLNRINSSLNHGLFVLTNGVTVTPPVPVLFVTVNETVVLRVRPPPIPVTITVAGPSVAVLEAVKVSVLLFPVGAPGLNAALTPTGNPLALKVTPAVKLVRVMLITLLTVPLRATDTLAGMAPRVKFCGGFTVKLIDVICGGSVPLVPVTVTVAGPSVAVLEAVKVNKLLFAVVDVGLKAAVTPVGNPLALKATLALKLTRVMLIVLVTVEPCVTNTLVGLAASVKF